MLDDRLVTWQVALKPGRRFYAWGSSAGVRFLSVLSEAADSALGVVKDVDDARGAFTITVPLGQDSADFTFELGKAPRFVEGGKDAPRGQVLRAGARVRVFAARPRAVVDVLTDEVTSKAVPEGVPCVALGAVKTASADRATLVTCSGGNVEEKEVELRKVSAVMDARFESGMAETMAAGRTAVYLEVAKRPGKVDKFVIAVSDDPGRTTGVLKSADAAGRSLVVTATRPAGRQDVTVAVPAGAAFMLDGRDSSAVEALRPGRSVAVWLPRPLTVEAMPPAPAPAAKGH
jgi:hypothetical protein